MLKENSDVQRPFKIYCKCGSEFFLTILSRGRNQCDRTRCTEHMHTHARHFLATFIHSSTAAGKQHFLQNKGTHTKLLNVGSTHLTNENKLTALLWSTCRTQHTSGPWPPDIYWLKTAGFFFLFFLTILWIQNWSWRWLRMLPVQKQTHT